MNLIQHPLYLAMGAVVAVLGSWTALDLFQRVRVWVGQPRAAWLMAATLAMSLSLWSMHLIALFGLDDGSTVRYDPALIALSLAIALGATGFAFAASNGAARPVPSLGGGLIMGLGVFLMQYVGLASRLGPSAPVYSPGMMILSGVVCAAGGAAILSALRRGGSRNWRMWVSLAMGLAITVMHLSALASVRLLPGALSGPDGLGSLGLSVAIGGATVFVLFLASVAALFDRRFEAVAAVEAKRSEAQLRALLEQMPVGIVVCDASGAIQYTNPEAEHLLGRPADDAPPWLSGAPLAVDQDGADQDPETFALYRAVRLGLRTEGERISYRHADGSRRTFEVTAGPVRDGDGRIVQAVVTFHDVTAKLVAEKALADSQRMEGIGQLTGGVAHDFNNLLTAVLGNLALAARRIKDEPSLRLIENAAQAGRRGARLTEQLLAFSRRQRLAPQPVDVNALIGKMGGLFSSTLGGTVKVRVELNDTLPAALADPAQLELALLNLALNARDAMPGGGELVLSTELATLGNPRASTDPEAGRYVRIVVRDTGCGMPPEMMQRVFEPFFTTKPEGKGSGLGLSQALGLAKQLGGGVRIDSPDDGGCAVSVFLPVSAEAAEAQAPAASTLSGLQARICGARILLVDDDLDVRRFVADLLGESGCEVRVEGDGHAGLAALDDGPYDLMLLDFAMPGMTGAEVARQVRARLPALPILVMTGYLEHEAVLSQLGAQPILQKPFEPGELLHRISAMLKRDAHA